MKKLLALFLSLVMVASMFVGVAFASGTAVLNVTVTGTVARNQAVTISGSLLVAGTIPGTVAGVQLQHRAPGADLWTKVLPSDPTVFYAAPTFVFAHQFALAGDYRVAVVDATGAVVNAQGETPTTAAPALVHTVGTIAPSALAVTPGVASIPWDLNNQAVVPLTITRVVSGLTEHVAIGGGVDEAVVTVDYAGSNATFTPTGTGATLALTITRPDPSPATGTLTITVRTNNRNWHGTSAVSVTPRASFNAIVTPSVTPAVGTSTVFSITAFDAEGDGAGTTAGVNSFAYFSATLSGPFAAPTAVVVTSGTAGSFAAVTPRHQGTITATVVLYDAAHNVLHTVVREFTVAGVRVTIPVTTVRVGEDVALRAVVTDAAGNPISNARVTFTGSATGMFFTRSTTGLDVATDNPQINGMLATQPTGSSIANGEYAIDVRVRARGTITVTVETPTIAGDVVTWTVRASWPAAITAAATLGYTVTLEHTLLAGTGTAEDVMVTVLTTAGTAVTSGLTFVGSTGLTVGAPVHVGLGVWRVPLNVAGAAGAFTLTVNNDATAANATLTGTASITAVAPVVAITPAGDVLTSNFYDVITVAVTDPRTNVAVSRLITVAPRTVTTLDNVVRNTVTIDSSETRANADASWATGNSATAASHQFRIMARSAALSVAGVAQTPNVRVTVAGAPAIDLALAPATLVVGPAELVLGRTGTITVQLNDARGVAMAGKTVTLGGIVATATHTIPTGGVLSVVVRPAFPETGVMPPSNVTVSVTPDRAGATALTATIPVVAPPADATAPVITTNAPATTTAATVPVTITATDDVAVTQVIVDGVAVVVLPAASQTVVRTLNLAVGENNFVVQATDAAGNVAAHTITITRTEPPAPPAPPRDTTRPTIEVTAPSVTTDANAMLTIVARDNVAVTGIIFEGAPVSIFPGATVTILRTVALREGLNSFTLSVADAAGNVADRIIVIERRIPAPVAHVITIGRANPAIGLDVPANVRNGRLMVPFRWFAERILNATVDFQVVGAAEIVTLHRGNMHVELTLNSTIAKVNGVPVALDVAPFATGGRTLVPARFLAETFGYIVNWNPVNDEVTFTVRP